MEYVTLKILAVCSSSGVQQSLLTQKFKECKCKDLKVVRRSWELHAGIYLAPSVPELSLYREVDGIETLASFSTKVMENWQECFRGSFLYNQSAEKTGGNCGFVRACGSCVAVLRCGL